MSDFQICRLKGGFRVHRKLAGESKAICGATYGKRTATQMRDRRGWWIYNEDYEFPHPLGAIHDARCKICFRVPE